MTRITSNPARNFADRSPCGKPYLAYSQHLKERYGPNSNKTVKGVINAHCTAMHWAWLMAEASRLYGDPDREKEWRAVIARYHEGSKEMFHLAYPAHRWQNPAQLYFGLLPYQRDHRALDATKMVDTGITFGGIAAGYLDTGTYEPEFADIVERVSRSDFDPFDHKLEPCPVANYVAQLARVFPTTLAFAMSEEDLPRYFMDGLKINGPCNPSDDQEVNSRWAIWDTYREMKVLTGDFNNDGKADVMKFDVDQAGQSRLGGLWVGLSDGTKFNTSQWARWTTSRHMKVLAGDFNGDGKTDLMKFDVDPTGNSPRGELWVGISDGRRFQTSLWSRWDTYPDMMVLAGDFDGDRDTDVMKFDVPRSGTARQGLWVGLSEPFAHDGPDMIGDLSAASLLEVLEYDPWSEKAVHNPVKFIKEQGGRKWILTNTKFKSTWAPGFWEEVDPQSVPVTQRFAIQATVPPDQTMGHYSAYRMGNKIFVMTDYSGGTLTIELPGSQLPRGSSQLSIKRQMYNESTGRWGPEQPAAGIAISTGSSGKVLVQLQQVQRKALTIVVISP